MILKLFVKQSNIKLILVLTNDLTKTTIFTDMFYYFCTKNCSFFIFGLKCALKYIKHKYYTCNLYYDERTSTILKIIFGLKTAGLIFYYNKF